MKETLEECILFPDLGQVPGAVLFTNTWIPQLWWILHPFGSIVLIPFAFTVSQADAVALHDYLHLAALSTPASLGVEEGQSPAYGKAVYELCFVWFPSVITGVNSIARDFSHLQFQGPTSSRSIKLSFCH